MPNILIRGMDLIKLDFAQKIYNKIVEEEAFNKVDSGQQALENIKKLQ